MVLFSAFFFSQMIGIQLTKISPQFIILEGVFGKWYNKRDFHDSLVQAIIPQEFHQHPEMDNFFVLYMKNTEIG
jgi:hypothetical protein